MAENTAVTPASFMSQVLEFIGVKSSRLTELETQVAGFAKTQADLTQAQADLATARQTISTVTTEKEALAKENAALKARDAEVTKQATEMEAEITRRANLMAGEKLSKVGVPAVTEETKSNPGALTAGANTKSWTERCIAANAAKAGTK